LGSRPTNLHEQGLENDRAPLISEKKHECQEFVLRFAIAVFKSIENSGTGFPV
jgi:hypothetical protein